MRKMSVERESEIWLGTPKWRRRVRE